MSITPRLIRNIQRKSPVVESFWTGTETTLRTKPVQLRSAVPAAPGGGGSSEAPAARPAAAPAAVPDTSGVRMSWKGPKQAKVGQPVVLELMVDSQHALRATPLQLAFSPEQFEIVAVKEGDFFSKAGKSNFSQVVDKASGRVSVGMASNEAAGAKGDGRLLTIEVKPLAAAANAEIGVIGMTPIGSGQAVQKPVLPVSHQITVE
jgi:general secretion pathway protein D